MYKNFWWIRHHFYFFSLMKRNLNLFSLAELWEALIYHVYKFTSYLFGESYIASTYTKIINFFLWSSNQLNRHTFCSMDTKFYWFQFLDQDFLDVLKLDCNITKDEEFTGKHGTIAIQKILSSVFLWVMI